MEKLPLEITADILDGLPMSSRLQCREVCTTWRTLIPKPKMGLLYEVSRHTATETEAQFYFSEEKSDKVVNATKLDHALIMPPSIYKNSVVGSCNGLVCYAGRYSLTTRNQRETETKVYVCNPVTGEHIQLPSIKWLWANTAIGFGCTRSCNKYKVVSVQYMNQAVRVQVYTLQGGDDGWRDKGNMTRKGCMSRLSVLPSAAVFSGGALYWMDLDSFKLNPVAFDLEQETLEWLPLIPSVVCVPDNAKHVGLMELRGNFCVLLAVPSRHISVWELRHRNIDKHGRCWHKMLTIAWKDYSWFEPNCDICLLYCNVILSCYDLETGILKKLDETLVKFNKCSSRNWNSRIIPHMNSLVSLEALTAAQKENKCSSRNRKGKTYCYYYVLVSSIVIFILFLLKSAF